MANTLSLPDRGTERRDTAAPAGGAAVPDGPLAHAIGRTRFVVLLAVVAVLAVSLSLFVLGTLLAGKSIWSAWAGVFQGQLDERHLTVQSLDIVSVMLKAVVFYLIGVGLYSLFIAPLNVTVALGVETFYDLESKVVSVVIVILGITFLEHFVLWQSPVETLQHGAAMALVVGALVFFQSHTHRAREHQAQHAQTQVRARRDLFHKDHEEHEVRPEDAPPAEDGRSGHERDEPRESLAA